MLLMLFLAMFPVVVLIRSDGYTFYDPYVVSCSPSINYDKNAFAVMIGAIVFLVVPMISTIIANISIVYIASKQAATVGRRCGINEKTIITISSICWGFILSYIPRYIDLCFDVFSIRYPAWFEIFQIYMLSINVIMNPMIYTITNDKFREYVKHMCTLNRCNHNITHPTEQRCDPNDNDRAEHTCDAENTTPTE